MDVDVRCAWVLNADSTLSGPASQQVRSAHVQAGQLLAQCLPTDISMPQRQGIVDAVAQKADCRAGRLGRSLCR